MAISLGIYPIFRHTHLLDPNDRNLDEHVPCHDVSDVSGLRLARCHDLIVDRETLSWRLPQEGPLSMSFLETVDVDDYGYIYI